MYSISLNSIEHYTTQHMYTDHTISALNRTLQCLELRLLLTTTLLKKNALKLDIK